MDDRLRLFVWVLGCGGSLGLLGAAFGALAGSLCWKSGRAAGTTLGLAVARSFARVSGRDLPPARQGAIVGAVDGMLFLGLLGCALGAWEGYRGGTPWDLLVPAAGFGVLMAAAAFFGVLAYGVVRHRGWALAAQVGGCVVGAFIGADLGELTGLLFGVVLGGIAAGVAVFLFLPEYAPHFTEPKVQKTLPPKEPGASTDVYPGPSDSFFPHEDS